LTILKPPSAAHRKLWFNNQQGQFTDVNLRKAVAFAVDRQQIIDTIYAGGARLANDHPIDDTLPFFPEGAVEQRARDLDVASDFMSQAGVSELTTSIATEAREEMPDMCALIAQNISEIGITASVNQQDTSTFFGDSWCPGPSGNDPETLPCNNSAEFGLVGWGNRPVPNVFLTSAFKTGAVWNEGNYANPAYDEAVTRYERAIDVEGQKSALAEVVQILHEDTPAVFHTFQGWQTAVESSVTGVEATALGHTFTGKARTG
jgi:peptide/nickel transport system substrate-binding protein